MRNAWGLAGVALALTCAVASAQTIPSARFAILQADERAAREPRDLATIRTGVYIQGADFMAVWKDGKDLKDITYLQAGVKDMLDQLVWWTKALKVARDRDQLAAAA